ncbi:hypothetical protein SLS62_001590 [Diatrype stigma]|uniref:Putative phospholipase n=1 Tax=Diatrype stigma TaxID=117547 RepID=A0AAN9YVW9_9PEZI
MHPFFRTLRGPLPPRFTVRYLLGLSAALYISYCFLTNQPLLSNRLPAYDGSYDVGTIDIEVPSEAPRNFSDAILIETGETAFRLDTVLFTVFYPASPHTTTTHRRPDRRHLWVPRPINLHAEGYARFASISNFLTNKLFAGVLWALVGDTEIPADVDVALQGSSSSDGGGSAGLVQERRDGSQAQLVLEGESDNESTKFPVLVFSHGMASMRSSYTHYLASLASRGYVVAAVEHRDGSGPGSIVFGNDGTEKKVFHAPRESIDPVPEVEDLKKAQLGLRQAEVEETVKVLGRINHGHGAGVFEDNLRGEGLTLVDWKGRLDMDQVVVGGHSYGATLAMQALKDAPSPDRPFKGGIILDPGKSSGPLNVDIDVPILVIHSQSWSKKHSLFYGRPHFSTVKGIVRNVLAGGNDSWFMTARGTAHTSVTDAPLIEPTLLSWTTGSTVDALEGVMQYVSVSDEFLRFLGDGRRPSTGVLSLGVTHPEYDQGKVVPPAEGLGMHWQIHVSPIQEE